MRKALLVCILMLNGCVMPWMVNEQRIDNVETRISTVEVELKKVSPGFKPAEVKEPETGGGIDIGGLWNAIPIPSPFKEIGVIGIPIIAGLFRRKKKREPTA